jgi:hypothetical protein
MPGYLDKYGAGEERRESIIKRSVIVTLICAVVLGLSWYILKNHHQEGVVKTFLDSVRRGDLQSAYREWGCTQPKPCSGYDFTRFSGDWGPAQAGIPGNDSGQPDTSLLHISDSETCNNGVLLTVEVNSKRTEKLWVDRSSDDINYAPYPICPHKTPFAIMLHRTIGQLRKPLLK